MIKLIKEKITKLYIYQYKKGGYLLTTNQSLLKERRECY